MTVVRLLQSVFFCITCIVLSSVLIGCGARPPLPREVERAFYDQVIDHPKPAYACVVSSEKCSDIQIIGVVQPTLSPALQSQGIDAAWCLLFVGTQRHPINRDYYQFREVALVTKRNQSYQAIETFDGNVADAQVCPTTSAWW